jgi:hypothetical protein
VARRDHQAGPSDQHAQINLRTRSTSDSRYIQSATRTLVIARGAQDNSPAPQRTTRAIRRDEQKPHGEWQRDEQAA